MSDAVHVTAITPRASDAEVAAIAAAIALLVEQDHAAAATVGAAPGHPERLDAWVAASRRATQRAGLQRGPWRLSGRLGRRSRT